MWWQCTCPGYWDSDVGMTCGYCRSQDPDGVNATGASMDERVQTLVALTAVKSDVTQGVVDLMLGRKCFRDKLALSVLGHAGDGLRYEPVRFKTSAS